MEQYQSIRKKLESKRKQLEKRINQFKQRPGRLKQVADPDSQEQAVERQIDEVTNYLDQKAHAELQKIIEALSRMDHDQYGICISCGNKISTKRLEALPFTDRCISCAE